MKERMKALSRMKNKKFLKNKKADFHVGGYVGYYDSRKSNCEICGVEIFILDKKDEMDDLVKKNAKYVCPECVLKEDKKNKMPIEQRIILEEIVEKHKNATLRKD